MVDVVTVDYDDQRGVEAPARLFVQVASNVVLEMANKTDIFLAEFDDV